jgi:hypothetical protein
MEAALPGCFELNYNAEVIDPIYGYRSCQVKCRFTFRIILELSPHREPRILFMAINENDYVARLKTMSR